LKKGVSLRGGPADAGRKENYRKKENTRCIFTSEKADWERGEGEDPPTRIVELAEKRGKKSLKNSYKRA